MDILLLGFEGSYIDFVITDDQDASIPCFAEWWACQIYTKKWLTRP